MHWSFEGQSECKHLKKQMVKNFECKLVEFTARYSDSTPQPDLFKNNKIQFLNGSALVNPATETIHTSPTMRAFILENWNVNKP